MGGKTAMKKLSLRICTPIFILLVAVGACSKSDTSPLAEGTSGVGGSLARFTIANDHLYTVSDGSISTFDISNANDPVKKGMVQLGFGIETIFPKGDNLFLGTQFGMKILDIKNPEKPVEIANYEHIRSCDPVVASGNYAYVTLRDGTACSRGLRELQIVNISNPSKPVFFKSYPMNQPFGLAIDGTKLFICDQGIKFYDATDPGNLILKKTFNVDAHDVIAYDNILMAIGSDGLNQYDYSTGDLTFLSRIPTL